MQLDDLESFISKLYRINLTQLVRLSELREEEGGLSLANVSEYNVRIRDDDKYRKIKTELESIKEGGDTDHLFYLLSERLDELSDDSVERIRRRGRVSGRKVSRLKKKMNESKDKDFLESCMIKGDTSWIK